MTGTCRVCGQTTATHPHFRRPVATIHNNLDGIRCPGTWQPFQQPPVEARRGITRRALHTIALAVAVAANEWAPRHPGISVRSYPAPKALGTPSRSIP